MLWSLSSFSSINVESVFISLTSGVFVLFWVKTFLAWDDCNNNWDFSINASTLSVFGVFWYKFKPLKYKFNNLFKFSEL